MAEMLCLHGINFAGGTDKLIANRTGVMKIYNSSTSVWDNVGSPTFNASSLIDSENFLDHAFFVNGTDSNYSYNSSGTWSATTNVSDSPKAKFIKSHKEQLFLANIVIRGTSYRSRVWHSDVPSNNSVVWGIETGTNLAQTSGSAVVTSSGSTFQTNNIKVGDPIIIEDGTNAGQYIVRSIDSQTQLTLTETLSNTVASSNFWVGGNWFDVLTDDGDVITGIGENSNELLFFKVNSLSRYNHLAGTLRQVKNTPGTPSGRSIVNHDEYTYYYDSKSDAIRRYDGVNAIILSNAIEDLIKNISSSNRSNVVGWVTDGKIIEMYIGTTADRDGNTYTNCVISWDTITETWFTRELPFTIEQATSWEQSDKYNTYVGTGNGKVLKVADGNSYAGTSIAVKITDQIIYPVGKESLVTFDRIMVHTKNGHKLQGLYKLIYMPVRDGEYTNSGWIPLKGKATGDLSEFFFSGDELNRACGIQIKFIESSSVEEFDFEGYTIYYSDPAII